MGLFNRTNIPTEIFAYTEVVLDDFSQNINMFDCDGNCDINTFLTLIGYFSYYIAGTTKPKYATQVINLFCDKYVTASERISAETMIQEYYFRAKRMAEMLMSYGEGLCSILEGHSESLCVLNNWEITDNNKNLLISVLENYYTHLLAVK